jgi:hypothetical protein
MRRDDLTPGRSWRKKRKGDTWGDVFDMMTGLPWNTHEVGRTDTRHVTPRDLRWKKPITTPRNGLRPPLP